jgi:hypothetical protein
VTDGIVNEKAVHISRMRAATSGCIDKGSHTIDNSFQRWRFQDAQFSPEANGRDRANLQQIGCAEFR